MRCFIHTLSPFSFKLSLFISGILAFACPNVFAQGDLLISPIRIVFEGSKKSQEINLANVGKDTASYVISIQDYRMKEDGLFEEIKVPDSGQNFAGPFLRFFPRKVTLAPNEAQVVKIQLIRTNELAPGEYRSHLYFRSVPDEKPLGDKPSSKDTVGISIELKPIFGITIPVIIRVGENTSDITMSNLFYYTSADSAKKPMLHISFNRTGNMSVYGDLKVDYINNKGRSTEVSVAKGIGVYTPNAVRNFNAILDDKGINYHSGKLHVTYTLQTNERTPKVVEADVELK